MIPGISTVELINSIAVLILAALIGWARYREKKISRKHNLLPNPARCARNEERLNTIEAEIKDLKSQMRHAAELISDIKVELARLEAREK